jgi:polysaccharide export outer membrane protein
MKKWLLGIFALVAVCVWPPALDGFQAAQSGQPPVVAPLSREFAPKPYTVGPGDKIRLVFYNLDDTDLEMKNEYLVEAAGTIQLKYLGSVVVMGLTTQEIEEAIEKALVAKQVYPPGVVQVSAQVSEERQQPVTVQGAVQSPGEKQLRGREMTVSRAINAAGGMTSSAGEEIEIKRVVNGKTEIIPITKTQLNLGDDPPLMADDMVTVKTGYVFFVNGEVLTPGQKVWAPGMTVLKAIALAGGMTPKGKYGHIERAVKDADSARRPADHQQEVVRLSRSASRPAHRRLAADRRCCQLRSAGGSRAGARGSRGARAARGARCGVRQSAGRHRPRHPQRVS